MSPAGHDAADAEQQPGTAQLGEQLGIGFDQFVEPAAEQLGRGLDTIEEAGFEHHVENGVAGRHRQRIAAKGRAVGAGDHADRGALGREAGADRKAAAQRLGDRHDVGRDPGPFIGEQPAGPPHAALHLVEDQQQAELVGDRAQARADIRPSAARTPPSP